MRIAKRADRGTREAGEFEKSATIFYTLKTVIRDVKGTEHQETMVGWKRQKKNKGHGLPWKYYPKEIV